MPSIVFPAHADELTPELLTDALAERHPGVRVERLRVLDTAHCMTGSASTAGRVVLSLDYAARRDGGLPRRVLLKTMLVRPGALAAMYRNEVRFYQLVRPGLDIETPRVFASLFDEASGRVGIVMEDLSLRSARFPNATTAMRVGPMARLLSQLAALHARFWQSPRFEADLAWLWTPRSGGFHDFLQSAGLGFITHLVERSEYKQRLVARLGWSLPELWKALWTVQAALDAPPFTLVHGDCHFGNTYLLPDDTGGLVDWQLMHRGRWIHDVTYLLVTALDVATRRGNERALLDHYLGELRRHGVVDPPSRDEAWQLHRRAALWGLVLGWLICPTENYGEAVLRANLERLATAVEDLDTLGALTTRTGNGT